MFAAARRRAKKIIADESSKEGLGPLPDITPQDLPESYTLSQLQSELADDNISSKKTETLENIVILRNCLANPTRLSRDNGDEDNIRSISIWISKSILPDSTVISESDIPSDDEPAHIAKAVRFTQHRGRYGFEAIHSLQTLLTSSNATLDPQILLSAIAFGSRDPWTTPEIYKLALSILDGHSEQVESSAFIVDYVLQKFIRPLFSKSRPSTITETGRKAMPSSEPPQRFDVDAEKRDKPWKYTDVYALTVFEWVIEDSSDEIISQSWNLFIPPLLTLIDDPSTSIRSRGLTMLSTFVPRFPPKILLQTGLGPVFEDAIHPTLLFLPSLTPVEESLQLLPPSYKALEVLAEVRFAEDGQDTAERVKFFDRVIREGVLAGFFHAAEHPAIIEVILTQLSVFVSKMGIQSVKHLKDTIPILSTILTDPFTTPSLLYTAIVGLSTLIQNAWPRISQPAHRRRILIALVICWGNISGLSDEYRDGLVSRREATSGKAVEVPGSLREELIKVGRLFVSVVEGDVDMKPELDPLIDADSDLAKLLGR